MRFFRRVFLGMTLMAAVMAAPTAAQAGWPLDGERSAPLVEFGESYAESGTSTVHHGVDIAGRAGQEVLAPLAGRVTFVGRVPAARGTTVLALTILTAKGSITLLPLDRAAVSRGDEPAEGDPIAPLAEAGDSSSAGTHLHVGLRTGSLYLDPVSALGPAPATEVAEPEGGTAEATEPVVEPATGSVAGVPAPLGPNAVPQAGAGPAVGGVGTVGAGGLAVTVPSASSGAHMPAATSMPTVLAAARTEGRVAARAYSEPSKAVERVGAAAGELAPGVSLASAADVPGSGFEPTGVFAETGETLATGGKLAQAASSAISEGRLGVLASRGIHAATRGARSAALAAVGVMCALGALWPLWRAGGLEGPVKVPVSAVRKDVAAVASR